MSGVERQLPQLLTPRLDTMRAPAGVFMVSFRAVVTQFKEAPDAVRAEFTCPVLVWDGEIDKPLPRDMDALEVTGGLGIASSTSDLKTVFRVAKNAESTLGGGVTIGRVGSNDIAIGEPSVSRFHAYMRQDEDGSWLLIDTGSFHGTFVNERKLAPEERATLTDGAGIRFGGAVVQFLTPASLLSLLEKTH